MNFLDLAPELIVQILAYLDFQDILRSTQVCRELKDIVDDSLLLRYQIGLATAGLTDGVQGPLPNELSLSDKYTKLLLYDATWRSFGWRKQETLHMRDSTALWDLYGGVLGTGSPIENNKEHWRLEFRELESAGRRGFDLQVSHWGFEVDLPLVEIAMDPTQDLLALLAVTETPTRSLSIHFRTLSSNTPHPAAKDLGIIQYKPPDALSQNLFDRRLGPWVVVQIHRTLLGLMVFSEGHPGDDSDDSTTENDAEPTAHLVIWDWTTGQTVANILGLRGLVTFAFLSTRYVILSRLGNAKQTTTDDRSSPFSTTGAGMPHQPALDVYDLSQFRPGSTQHETSFTRRYLLPNVKSTARVQMVRVFSELTAPLPPARASLDYSGKAARSWESEHSSSNKNTWVGSGAPAPFTIASHSRIFVVRIVLAQRRRTPGQIAGHWTWQSPTQEYALLIPLTTLLPGANSSDELNWRLDRYVPLGSSPSLLVKTIAWRDWGPHGTRLLPLEFPQNFFDVDRSFYPYGPRVAIPLRSAQAGKFRLRLLNVNQLAVRHFVHSRKGMKPEMVNGNHSIVHAVLEPSTVSWDTSHFERDVTTYLPYLETCTSEDVAFECDCFMLTEDNLFTVKAEDSFYSVQIYTF